MTKVCKTCGLELPIERFERQGNCVRRECTRCRNLKRKSQVPGKPRGVTHQPGYEGLLGGILDRAAMDYKAGKAIPMRCPNHCDHDKPDAWTSNRTGEFLPWERDASCWRGLVCGPGEVLDAMDEMMVYFRATDTYLSPEELRDTFMRVRLGVTPEVVK